jgi:hypothetical protein
MGSEEEAGQQQKPVKTPVRHVYFSRNIPENAQKKSSSKEI